jgi:hypothetical protein
MKKQTTKVLVSPANVKPCRFSRAVWVSICFCALAFAVRSAHAALCKWSLEEVVVVTAQFTEEQKKDLYELIDELMKSVAPKPPQIDAIEKLIEGIGGDMVEVVIIYSCRDDITGDTYRKKVELDHTEDFHWAAKMMKDEEAAKKRKDLIEKFRPKGTCCKATPTPSPSPSPSPPTPTPTPTSTPSRRVTYTGQTPTPSPQGHGMVPRQPRRPGKTGETCAVLIATGKIKVETSGTGETIGTVVNVTAQNQTNQQLDCVFLPTVFESISGKNQSYACPTGQTVALNPHQTKTVPMNGVCLNRNKPPVGKGVSGDLVMNEANPSGPQNPNAHLPPADAGKLLRSCAAKYTAADQLQKSGALKNLPYHDPQKQKDIVVQWSTWTDPQISQMTGSPPATKEDLKKVVYKQVEEKGPMSPETKKKVDQGIDTIFEKVELTTAKAKDLEKSESENVPPAQTPAG